MKAWCKRSLGLLLAMVLLFPATFAYAEDEHSYAAVYGFQNGLAIVEKHGKYGYIDTTGKLAIPCQYDKAWYFHNGMAIITKDGKYGFIDTTGKEVVPC